MRLVPTIFICNQLIRHHGVFVNNEKISLPSFRIKLGDIVTINSDQ
jgi:ribosomal protein S4